VAYNSAGDVKMKSDPSGVSIVGSGIGNIHDQKEQEGLGVVENIV
jgi:hypothetical protein